MCVRVDVYAGVTGVCRIQSYAAVVPSICACVPWLAPLLGRDDEIMPFLCSVQTHTRTSWLRIAGTPNAVRSTAAQPRPDQGVLVARRHVHHVNATCLLPQMC